MSNARLESIRQVIRSLPADIDEVAIPIELNSLTRDQVKHRATLLESELRTLNQDMITLLHQSEDCTEKLGQINVIGLEKELLACREKLVDLESSIRILTLKTDVLGTRTQSSINYGWINFLDTFTFKDESKDLLQSLDVICGFGAYIRVTETAAQAMALLKSANRWVHLNQAIFLQTDDWIYCFFQGRKSNPSVAVGSTSMEAIKHNCGKSRSRVWRQCSESTGLDQV
jgi:hypothetical protein